MIAERMQSAHAMDEFLAAQAAAGRAPAGTATRHLLAARARGRRAQRASDVRTHRQAAARPRQAVRARVEAGPLGPRRRLARIARGSPPSSCAICSNRSTPMRGLPISSRASPRCRTGWANSMTPSCSPSGSCTRWRTSPALNARRRAMAAVEPDLVPRARRPRGGSRRGQRAGLLEVARRAHRDANRAFSAYRKAWPRRVLDAALRDAVAIADGLREPTAVERLDAQSACGRRDLDGAGRQLRRRLRARTTPAAVSVASPDARRTTAGANVHSGAASFTRAANNA